METFTVSIPILRGAVDTAYRQYRDDYDNEISQYFEEVTAYTRRLQKLVKDKNLLELATIKPPDQPVDRSAEFEQLLTLLSMTIGDRITIPANTFARCVMNKAD